MKKSVAIYHNPRCMKSRETLELIEKKGIAPTIIEYLKNTPTQKELKEVIILLGIKPEELVRKKEKIFLEKFAKKKYSDAEWIKILAENPILIERPIVVANKKAAIGRPPENVLRIL